MTALVRNSGLMGTRLFSLLEQPKFLPMCLLLSLLPRVAILAVQPLEQTSDFRWYFERAASIARGDGYSENGVLTAFWPVGWPAALAGLFRITGSSVLAGQLANLAMSLAICILTAALGTSLFRSRAVGNLAALILVIYPNQIAYVPLLSAEIFYELLLLISIWLLMRERVGLALLAGVFFGIATLTKTQTVALPGFVLTWVFLSAPRWATFRRFVLLGGAVYITLALVVVPWTYRNWTVFHALVPVSTNGGWTLLTGNNPQAMGDYTPETTMAEGISHNPADQLAMDRLARERAITWIVKNPMSFVDLLPRKLLRLWLPDGEAEWFYQRGFAAYDDNAVFFRITRVINQAYYFLILTLAVPSIWILIGGHPANVNRWARAGVAACVFVTFVSLIFSGQSRFHFGLMPFIAMYAAWTVTRFVSVRPKFLRVEALVQQLG